MSRDIRERIKALDEGLIDEINIGHARCSIYQIHTAELKALVTELEAAQAQLERVNRMLEKATGIDFMVDDMLLPDVRLSKGLWGGIEGKWYVSLDNTVFIETPHDSAIDAFESNEGE